jgi:hypothetical protein
MPRGNYVTFENLIRPIRRFTRKDEYIDEIKLLIMMFAHGAPVDPDFWTNLRTNVENNELNLPLGMYYEEYRKEYEDRKRSIDISKASTKSTWLDYSNTFFEIKKESTETIGKKDIKDLVIYIAYPAFLETFQNRFMAKIKDAGQVSQHTLKGADLIIFSGGEDINPGIYGERNTYSYGYSASRDDIETRVFQIAKQNRIKMLGVCRGHQLINALQGGTLYQDLYFDIGKPHGGGHPLELVSSTGLANLFKDGVNSIHH